MTTPAILSRSRAWCWTAYEPNLIEAWLFTLDPRYWCYGVEKCPETGRTHWQGYLELTTPKTLVNLKKNVPKGIHLESRKGSQAQAIDYCKKDNDFHQFGQAITQGKRTDLDRIKKSLDEGMQVSAIASTDFAQWCRYRRSFEAYARLALKDRDWITEIHILWGATGTGKTRYAISQGAVMVEMDKGGFMHGYDNQPILLFDDFDPETISRSVFLRLTDRYATTVNVKGGSMSWNPKTIYITSNYSPGEWYSSCPAVRRRFTTVTQMAQLFVGERHLDAIPSLTIDPVSIVDKELAESDIAASVACSDQRITNACERYDMLRELTAIRD